MSLLEGFEVCNSKPERKSRWKAMLFEFLDSGAETMRKSYDDAEEAKSVANALHQAKVWANRDLYMAELRKHIDEDQFEFVHLDVIRSKNTVYIYHKKYRVTKHIGDDGKPAFPRAYDAVSHSELVEG